MQIIGSVSELNHLASSKAFGTIYMDPPWTYVKKKKKGAASNHYRTMTIQEITELPVERLALPKSHLHLWTTTPLLKNALSLMDTWGFDYKGMFVWCKSEMGLGNYWRISHEILLLGVKGKLTFRDHAMRSWLNLRRGRHSEKPEAVRSLIEKVSPEPRIELFARKAIPGWTVFGDQIEISEIQSGLELK